MKEQKKDRSPAKESGLIFGNHVKHGINKIHKGRTDFRESFYKTVRGEYAE